MTDEGRENLLQAGLVEEYETEDGRLIQLFFGPYSVFETGGYVAKRGYAVDVAGNYLWNEVRNWYPTLQEADKQVFRMRAKDAIDIAKEAFRLRVTNTPIRRR
jgi:hypothetical protein